MSSVLAYFFFALLFPAGAAGLLFLLAWMEPTRDVEASSRPQPDRLP